MIVSIEGLDGSGKSTIIKEVAKKLTKHNVDVLITSEPTDGPIGKLIKEYLKKQQEERDRRLEALLFAADRLWHWKNVIHPAITSGKIVITDRYLHSSLAYQSTDATEEKWILEINKHVPDPDISLFINVPPEVCLERIRESGRSFSIMENIENLEVVYKRYLDLAKRGKMKVINGIRSVEEISDEIVTIILNNLRQKH